MLLKLLLKTKQVDGFYKTPIKDTLPDCPKSSFLGKLLEKNSYYFGLGLNRFYIYQAQDIETVLNTLT